MGAMTVVVKGIAGLHRAGRGGALKPITSPLPSGIHRTVQ